MVARLVRDQEVVGSSPVASTKKELSSIDLVPFYEEQGGRKICVRLVKSTGYAGGGML